MSYTHRTRNAGAIQMRTANATQKRSASVSQKRTTNSAGKSQKRTTNSAGKSQNRSARANQASKQKSRAVQARSVATAQLILPTIVGALVIIGLIMVFSTTSVDLAANGENVFSGVLAQAAYAILGILAALFVYHLVPYTYWETKLTWLVWFVCLGLVVLTYFFGTEVNGAKRWLYIGPIGMQPSEFLKIALMLMSIKIMDEVAQGHLDFRMAAFQGFIFVVLPLVFLYWAQSDLGTTLICFVGIFAVLWLARVPAKFLIAIALIVLAGVVLAVAAGGYRSSRFVYLDPWNDGDGGYGAGYNIIRSYYAISSGGIFGVGLGNSYEKYDYLFASDNDFIFAVICEEMGLIGALVVIALFLGLLYAGLKIAEGAPDTLGSMIAGGFAIILVLQAFINIGCAIGVFPTTGKPLPFISSGGTSIVTSLIMVGLILSVCKTPSERTYEKRRDNLRVTYGGRY